MPNIDEQSNDDSTHNASSLIFLFLPEGLKGKKYLFPGDATRESLEMVKNSFEGEIRNCYWLKVLHHGSIHNLTTRLISHINPEYAAISAQKHPASEIIEAFMAIGSKVYSTSYHDDMLFRRGTDSRKGWTPTGPL